MKVYDSLSWTRLVTLHNFLPGQQENYPLGPDVAKEVDVMFNIDEEDHPEWTAIFDPLAFQKQHRTSERRTGD